MIFTSKVHKDGDSKEDAEARALLNKFLGATALMTGIEKNSGLSKEFLSSGTASSKNPRVSFLFAFCGFTGFLQSDRQRVEKVSTMSTARNKRRGRALLHEISVFLTIICGNICFDEEKCSFNLIMKSERK